MADEYLQALANKPLKPDQQRPGMTWDRANKIWLPNGRTPPKRADEAELMNRRANTSARRVRENQAAGEKLNALLDYYATTTVPLERVATHIGKDVDFVANEMRQRGRKA